MEVRNPAGPALLQRTAIMELRYDIPVMPCEYCVELGGNRILYSDLADWLRELHGCARKLSSYRENGVA